MPVDAKASHTASFVREKFLQGVAPYGIGIDFLKLCTVVADSASVNMTPLQERQGLKTALGAVLPCFCHIIGTCLKWSLLEKGKEGYNLRDVPNVPVIYEVIEGCKGIVSYEFNL
jgi:hypothetical protein